MEPRLKHCDTCAFWHPLFQGLGLCRRNPPQIVPNEKAARWPESDKKDWCGAWENGIQFDPEPKSDRKS
jgi:hypothetical protein